ncbi:RNA ligase family protein [Methanopyrus sp.]
MREEEAPPKIPEGLRITATRTMVAARPEEPEPTLRLLRAFSPDRELVLEEKLDGTNVRVYIEGDRLVAHTRGWVDAHEYLRRLGVEPPWEDLRGEFDRITILEGELLPYDLFSQGSPRLHELAGRLETEVLFDGEPSDTTAELVYLEGKRYECRPEPLFSRACELDPDHELIQRFLRENQGKPDFESAVAEGKLEPRVCFYELDMLEGRTNITAPRTEQLRECRRLSTEPPRWRVIADPGPEDLERELDKLERDWREGLCVKPIAEDDDKLHSVKLRCRWFLRREFDGRPPRRGSHKVAGRITAQLLQTKVLYRNLRELEGERDVLGRKWRKLSERTQRALKVQDRLLSLGLDSPRL